MIYPVQSRRFFRLETKVGNVLCNDCWSFQMGHSGWTSYKNLTHISVMIYGRSLKLSEMMDRFLRIFKLQTIKTGRKVPFVRTRPI